MQLKIGRAAGINVFLHWTFIFAPLYVIYELRWIEKQPWSIVLLFLLLIMLVFACILLHEFGHALMAKYFGVKTRDIIMTPIGGIARLERMPKKPAQELLVTIAGPAVNLGIAFLLLVGLVIAGQPLLPQGLSQMQYQIPQTLMLMNLFLFAFNLIPAFPMDGGRILRSCLAMFTDHATATKIAGILGQVVAVAFVVTGLVIGQVSLLVIGIFVFVAARVELAQAKRFPSG